MESRSWTPSQIRIAIEEVRRGNSVRSTANKYGIPKSTLHAHAKGIYKKFANPPLWQAPSTVAPRKTSTKDVRNNSNSNNTLWTSGLLLKRLLSSATPNENRKITLQKGHQSVYVCRRR